MASMDLNGRAVSYNHGGVPWEAGRPSVVFLHGAGMEHSLWQQQSRALAHQGYNVAALDLPGHGQSGDDPSISSVADYAAWLADFLERSGLRPAVLVGLSLGSAIALTCAAEYPERVSALVLIGAGTEMKVSPVLLRDIREDPPRAIDFITGYGHGRPSHIGRAPTPGNWLLGSAVALLRRNAVTLHRDFTVCHEWPGAVFVPKVRCPTLVAIGKGDRMTPPKIARELAEAIPGARFEIMEGCGHLVPSEAPRALLHLLRDFLPAALEKSARKDRA